MRYTLLLLIVLLAGCATPETARSAKQADQAVEGIGEIAGEAVKSLNSITDEKIREQYKTIIVKILKLVQAARLSLQPVTMQLSGDQEIKVDTTVKEAVEHTDTFVTKATLQAGKAAVEVQQNLFWSNLINSITDPDALEGMLVKLSLALFGSGTAGLIVSRIVKTIRTHKSALKDAVLFSKDVKKMDPADTEALADIKEKHASQQKANGTKDLIDETLKKVKDVTPT